MDKTSARLKGFRIAAGVLALLPLALLVIHLFFQPTYETDSVLEYAYLCFGVPILILNLWAWVHPEMIEFYFLGEPKKPYDSVS